MKIVLKTASFTFPMHASTAYDPFHNMIYWLEEITQGATSSSWMVNEEGPVVTLEFTIEEEGTGLLRVTKEYPKIELKVLISAFDLVKAFYRSFRLYVNSPAYEPYEWESLSLGEYLQERLHDSEDELYERLALYPAKALQQLRWHITPIYDFLGPGGRMKPEYQWKDIDDPIDAIRGGRCVAVIALPPIPASYDTATLEERKRLLRSFLKGQVKGCGGEKLRELTSPVIEEWLSSQR